MTIVNSFVEIGVDLGGTATRVVVRQGESTVGQTTVTTSNLGSGSPDQRVQNLWTVIERTLPFGVKISSIGIAASGPIDLRTGIINNADTLPWFSGFDIVGQLEGLSRVPVVVENDAVAAALGEYHHGAGRGADRLLLVTIGTGVGVSLLEDGRPFRQVDGQHPESGHIPIFGDTNICYCGLTGCWEQSASRVALEQSLQSLHSDSVSPVELINLIADRARGGDVRAEEAFQEYGRKVGRGLALLHAVYGPSVTVLGGAVANLLDLFSFGINRSLTRADGFYFPVPIVKADLGAIAGAVGAAALAKHTFGEDIPRR